MKARKTTKTRRRPRPSVLEVRVMSPRIAWFGFLKLAGRFTKLAVVLALIATLGWGVWRGIQHSFYQNPDFRLKMIKLNPNRAIDELGVATVAGIDLTGSPSLFDVDVKLAAKRLGALPEISEARVERHLPGTLVVRVVARVPKAWISSPGESPGKTRATGSLLVDQHGVVFPCPELQLETAMLLPVIELPASDEHPVEHGKVVGHPELEQCMLLLDSARKADPEAVRWIESIRQDHDWSLLLTTRQGTEATFGLGDHARQIESLRAALDHAGEKGYLIATINLIPKYNIPITLRGEEAAPRAIPVSAAVLGEPRQNRRTRDLNSLLERN